MDPDAPDAPGPPRRARRRGLAGVVDWLFRDRETGRIVIAQWPNVPLVIFLVARGADRVLDPSTSALRWIGTVALLWWAGDELIRGVNPWRRIAGATVLTATLVGLVGDWMR